VRSVLIVPALVVGLGLSAVASAERSATPPGSTSTAATSPQPAQIGFCPPSPQGGVSSPPCRKPPNLSAGARRAALLTGGAVQSVQTGEKGRTQVRFTLDHLYGRARKLLHGLGREAALAELPAGAPVIGPDGAPVDASLLADALAVRVRGRVLEARRWDLGEEGTALPTIRASRVQILGLASTGEEGDTSGDASTCDVFGTCDSDPCADGSCGLPTVEEPPPPPATSPVTSIARFIGEVTAVDAVAGNVTLHVVTVENLPGDQSEDDFDGDAVTFTFGPDATFAVTPDRSGDGAGNLADIAVGDLAKVDVEANDRLPVGSPLAAVFIDSRAP
jgi:hypothetical protein